MNFKDVAIIVTLLGTSVYGGVQAFSHPELTRTQLFLENWPVALVAPAVIVAAWLHDLWRKRRG